VDVGSITRWYFIEAGAIEMPESVPGNSDKEVEELRELVKEQRKRLDEQVEYLEDLRQEQEAFSTRKAGRLEDSEVKVGSRPGSDLNKKIIKTPKSYFKFKSSSENIVRLNKLRDPTLTAFYELAQDYGAGSAGFTEMTGAEAVQAVLQEIEEQGEGIRIAKGGGGVPGPILPQQERGDPQGGI
jgi:hypothetical protein